MPEVFRIREANTGDAEAACEVLRRSITEHCQHDYEDVPGRLEQWLANKTPETINRWISQDGFTLLLADDSGAIAGVAGIADSGVILLNYVSPDWRFKGISTALLAFMERQALQARVGKVQLESSKTALLFYQSRGYRTNPEKVDANGLWLNKLLS